MSIPAVRSSIEGEDAEQQPVPLSVGSTPASGRVPRRSPRLLPASPPTEKKRKVVATVSGGARPHAATLRGSPRFPEVDAEMSGNAGAIFVVNREKSSVRRSPKVNSNSDVVNKGISSSAGNAGARKSGEATTGAVSVTRSPRFSAAVAVDPGAVVIYKPEKCKIAEIKCVPEKSPRNSPRFDLNSVAAENGKIKSIPKKDSSLRAENNSAEKQVRRSPRFTENGHSNGSLMKSEAQELDFSEKKQCRKSPRFPQAKANGFSRIENSRDFSGQDVVPSSKKQLRSSTSTKLSQCTENGGSDENSCLFNTHEEEFFEEKQSGMFSKVSQVTENGGGFSSLVEDDMDILDAEHLRGCSVCSLSPPGPKSVNGNSIDGCSHPCKKLRITSLDSDIRKPDQKVLEQFPGTVSLPGTADQIDSGKESSVLSAAKQYPKKVKPTRSSEKNQKINKSTCTFIGDPIPQDEAQERWRWRYELKSQVSMRRRLRLKEEDDDEDLIISNVECHYAQACVLGCVFSIGDCAYIKGEGAQNHIGKILEFFRTTDGEDYFRVKWFYRAEDTVMKDASEFHDKRRLFYSTVMNDNPLDCILSKVSVTQKSPLACSKSKSKCQSSFYFDMEYCVDYSTFRNMPEGPMPNMINCEPEKRELALLDLFAGCGGMSTGLCLGAKVSRTNLVTKWAIDSQLPACESLRLNHPESKVRHEAAEDFFLLLKEWEKLCKRFASDVERTYQSRSVDSKLIAKADSLPNPKTSKDEFEVESLVDVCYGDPCRTGKYGLKFKVRWKGYGPSEDTWEPYEGLSNCEERIRDFVRNGYKTKILPLPGDVDVICGGPPCQGISGYNRYRNIESPLDDERNKQIIIFMDIVEYLKPKFVLMENVSDILRFDRAYLGRYALSRLVHMKYQARLGTIAAGCYGLPQFRLRVFLWGAWPSEKLPQFPLPTHDTIIRYWPPPEFERNTVAYDEGQPRQLEDALLLRDAISDLPAVENHEAREAMAYQKPPETEFQRYIRSSKFEMTGCASNTVSKTKNLLYDHRAMILHDDDYTRVCLIPKRKGANVRDLPGTFVGPDNVIRRDPAQEQKVLPSGRPLVPDYVFTFDQGKSRRPFGRLWWDETVPTVLTVPSCHNQQMLHPEQDRILTVREYARLQGFPDYYRFCGTVKERYCQIGNAVAVPVGRALGYALGMAIQKKGGNEPLMTLPPKFSLSNYVELSNPSNQNTD